MEMKGGTPIITGEIDLGGYAENLRVIKDQAVTQRLASEVIQITFVGFTGFRFLGRELQPLNWASLYGILM